MAEYECSLSEIRKQHRADSAAYYSRNDLLEVPDDRRAEKRVKVRYRPIIEVTPVEYRIYFDIFFPDTTERVFVGRMSLGGPSSPTASVDESESSSVESGYASADLKSMAEQALGLDVQSTGSEERYLDARLQQHIAENCNDDSDS